MSMLPLPQVAQDLQPLMDRAIMFASRAGEHMGVMESSVEKHSIEKNLGDVWKGAHVAKINAVHGGPRTRFSVTARASAEVYQCHLGYTVSLYSMGDNQKDFLNKNFLRQWGAQQGEAIARQVDRVMLSAFPNFTDSMDKSAQRMKANYILEQMFKLEAAEDESESPIQIIAPTAHMRDLVMERATAPIGDANIVRPLTPDAAKAMEGKPMIDILGIMVKQGKNSPKYGSTGYTGIFRKSGIKMVTAPVLRRENFRDPFTGGGADTMIIRKLWGFTLPPQALRNWLVNIQALMPIGGR